MNLFNNFAAETITSPTSAALHNIRYIMDSTTGPPGLTHPLLIENFAWIDLELERRDTAVLKSLCPIPLKWLRNKENISLEYLEREYSDTLVEYAPYPEMRLICQSKVSATGEYYNEYHYDLDNYSESDPDIHVMDEDEGFIIHVVSDDEGDYGDEGEEEEEDEEDEEDEYEKMGVHVVSDDEEEDEVVEGEGLPFEQVLW